MERMMDRIAEHLGLDPAEVRARNLIQADEFPYQVGIMFRDGSPLTYDSGDFPALLEGTLERIGYEDARAEQARLREQGRYVGIGLAVYVEGCGLGPYEGAKIRLTNTGTDPRHARRGAAGPGLRDGLRPDRLRRASAWTWTTSRSPPATPARIPFGQGTFASRITATAGPAVLDAAARDARAAARRPRRRCSAATPATWSSTATGRAWAATRRSRCPCSTSPRSPTSASTGSRCPGASGPGWRPPATSRPSAPRTPAARTPRSSRSTRRPGGVTILKYVIGHDCGNVINPLLVDGQVLGGFAHGIGNAMYEEPVYDAEGQPQAASYLDYALVSATEVPPVELFHIQTPSPLNPLGRQGRRRGRHDPGARRDRERRGGRAAPVPRPREPRPGHPRPHRRRDLRRSPTPPEGPLC